MIALKNWRFLLLYAAMAAVIWMSRLMFSAVAPVLKSALGLTYTQLGLVSMASITLAALGYGTSGFLSLRYGTRRVLLAAALTEIVGTFGTFISKGFGEVFVFQSILGLSEGLFYVAALAHLTTTFDPQRIGRVIGIVEASINIGVLASLTIGAFISILYGWRFAFLFLGFLGILMVLMIAVAPVGGVPSYHDTDLVAMLKNPFMIAVLIPTIFLFLSFWSFWAFVPTYLVDNLHLSYTATGFVGSLSFLLAIFSALLAGVSADHIGPKASALVVVTTYLVFLILFTFSSSIIYTVISLWIVSSTQAFMIPVLLSSIPKRFPRAELGRIYGLVIAIGYGGGAIGPFIVGRIADTYGFSSAFLTLALCVALAGLVILFKM